MNDPARLYAQAIDALNRADWIAALGMAGRLLGYVPEHGGVHFVAGVAALNLQRMPVAVTHLRRATVLSPRRADYLAQLARALSTGRFPREAIDAADRALSLAPEDALTLDTLGVVYSQANAHAKAVDVFRRAVELMPSFASYRFNLATSLTFAGKIDAAEREYESCLSIDPSYWKAHLALSQLRRQEAEHHHIDRLSALLPGAEGDGATYLNLALAKELEDLGEYERSFQHLSAGKAAKGATRGYASARDKKVFDALMSSLPEPAASPTGHTSREPIFVIGMPRTGTTLVERILSSHPAVHSGGELQNFGVCLKRASASQTPQILDVDTVVRSHGLDWRRLGEAYIESTRPGTGHTAHFVDKLPHNFLYAGHIARALPEARIIHLRRDPVDTCLSNFRQLFALTSPYYDYSFDLMDTGRYYLMYERLMRHWHRVLPGRILDVRYEDLVELQEAETRRMLGFCGLPWDEACLRFEDNDAPVATASAVQVRNPMNRGSLQRWRKYEDQLGELIALLRSAENSS